MQNVLKSPRNGCGLHGAVQTIGEIQGVVPIVHANAGCVIQNYLANRASGLSQGYASGESIPSTNVQERHVIFGGASRLREQIKNTIKVVNGDLYIVLNSCESAMVGDDIEAMTREAQEQGEPVIECLTAGFHGDSHYGYESVMTDIIKKLSIVKKTDLQKDAKLVNIFGILPQRDIYYKGNIAAIKQILEDLGVTVNTFFGPQSGVEEFVKAPNASLNLVFSKWGNAPADQLNVQYGIPKLVFSSLPTGPKAVGEFVRQVADALSLEEAVVNAYLEENERNFCYYFQGIIDSYYEEAAEKAVALVGDESNVIQIASFLKDYLGAAIEVAIVTDYFGKEELPQNEKSKILDGLANEVYFTQDGKEIMDILIHSDIELILGSSLENQAAEKKEILNLEISYPVYSKTIINKTYTGVQGAFTLAEDYITAVKKANRLRDEQLLSYIRG